MRVPAFVPAALSASKVGTWEYDVSLDRMRGDALAAELFDLDAELAEAGLRSDAFLAAVHPEDKMRADAMRTMVFEAGRVVSFELRVGTFEEMTRRVLIRGACHSDATGFTQCLGTAIDLSASKLDRDFEDRFGALSQGTLSALDEAAEYALAAHEAIERLDGPSRQPLLQSVKQLLHVLGLAHVRGRLSN